MATIYHPNNIVLSFAEVLDQADAINPLLKNAFFASGVKESPEFHAYCFQAGEGEQSAEEAMINKFTSWLNEVFPVYYVELQERLQAVKLQFSVAAELSEDISDLEYWQNQDLIESMTHDQSAYNLFYQEY